MSLKCHPTDYLSVNGNDFRYIVWRISIIKEVRASNDVIRYEDYFKLETNLSPSGLEWTADIVVWETSKESSADDDLATTLSHKVLEYLKIGRAAANSILLEI